MRWLGISDKAGRQPALHICSPMEPEDETAALLQSRRRPTSRFRTTSTFASSQPHRRRGVDAEGRAHEPADATVSEPAPSVEHGRVGPPPGRKQRAAYVRARAAPQSQRSSLRRTPT
jgi:hypothetical protein